MCRGSIFNKTPYHGGMTATPCSSKTPTAHDYTGDCKRGSRRRRHLRNARRLLAAPRRAQDAPVSA